MAWNFSKEIPIYIQIVEQIKINIISGVYKTGQKLPSVRDISAEAAVNPNTMQKALQELEKEELIFTQRTSGRFITEDKNMIEKLKFEFAEKQIFNLCEKMKTIGFSKKQIFEYIQKFFEEMDMDV